MKFAILHLSDFHFNKENSTWIIDRAHQVSNAVKLACANVRKIYVVVSGDIANEGMAEQYTLAEIFFSRLKSSLAANYNGQISVGPHILCVPGNHDVFLKEENKMRSILLKNVQDDYPTIDNSIYEGIAATQSQYADFVKKVNDDINYKPILLNVFEDTVDGYKIRFNLYNTAWMCGKKCQQGSIYMPVESFKQPVEKEEADFAISVMHHYYDWLAVDKRNKTNFMRHVATSSNLLIYGHEHEFIAVQKEDVLSSGSINEYEGAAFYDKDIETKEVQSQFELLVIDTEQSSCYQRTFGYSDKDKIYRTLYEKSHNVNSERKTGIFRSNCDFLLHLNDMPTPIYNHENEKLKLSEVYIYPDLEAINDKTNKKEIDGKYISAEKILGDEDHSLFILEGGNQCGKTSLCNMYYMWLADIHKYPLMISGKEINNDNIKRILRNAYEKQYLSEFAIYDKYEQHNESDKILLIDDFDKCKLPRDAKEKIFKEILLQFSKVIVTVREDKFILESQKYFDKDVAALYNVKPFGYEKRAKLINKFYEKYDEQNISPQEMLEKSNEAFRMVQQFLGKEYIPPYPIYILSLLLSSTKMLGQSYSQTAYGHCYDAIITCALLTQVKNEDVSQFRNFLKHFAFYKFIKKEDCLEEDQLREFYNEYKKRFVITNYDTCKNVLLNAGLLVCEDEYYYRFGYKYVYYFTVAEYISNIINIESGKSIIKSLCDEIKSEEAANILIFLTYHIDDEAFIDETIFTLMSSIEDAEPITLNKIDNFYTSIAKLCDEMKKETVDVFRKSDPQKAREEFLRQKDADELEREHKEDEIRQNERFQKIDKSLKAIEVVGQIIKNRRNTLEKSKLKEMLVELYYAGFRTIGYLGNTLSDDKKTLIEDIVRNEKLDGDTVKIREHINIFFELVTFRFCLFVFGKMINSVGVKELRWLYNEASSQIGSPAAEIVTFSIESVYSKLNVEDLKKLVEKYKDNSAAMTIISARVRSYLYNNYVEIKDRKKIANVLRFDESNVRIGSNAIPKRLHR